MPRPEHDAWDEFLASKPGQHAISAIFSTRAADNQATLQNRVRFAFLAGWDAAKATSPQAWGRELRTIERPRDPGKP